VTHLNEGPFDPGPWPDTLTARVVTPGASPRLHGYDCEAELARNVSMAEGVLLALTGELPGRVRARAFEIAQHFLAPVAVNEAPAHAAVLARLCWGSTSSILGTAAIALAEQARFTVSELRPHWEWLSKGSSRIPEPLRAADAEDRSSVARLREALQRVDFRVQALEHDIARTPAIVAALVACGLSQPPQVEAAWVLARLPVAFAEASAAKPGNLREYPWHLPRFRYTEDTR